MAAARRVPQLADDRAVRLWVSYILIGASAAGALHDTPRRTVYREVKRVEASPDLLARAQAALRAQQEARAAREAHVAEAAREALLARIRAGKITTKLLVAVLAELAPPAATGTGLTITLPAILATPREEQP